MSKAPRLMHDDEGGRDTAGRIEARVAGLGIVDAQSAPTQEAPRGGSPSSAAFDVLLPPSMPPDQAQVYREWFQAQLRQREAEIRREAEEQVKRVKLDLAHKIAEKETVIAEKETVIAEKEAVIIVQSTELQQTKAVIAEKETAIKTKQAAEEARYVANLGRLPRLLHPDAVGSNNPATSTHVKATTVEAKPAPAATTSALPASTSASASSEPEQHFVAAFASPAPGGSGSGVHEQPTAFGIYTDRVLDFAPRVANICSAKMSWRSEFGVHTKVNIVFEDVIDAVRLPITADPSSVLSQRPDLVFMHDEKSCIGAVEVKPPSPALTSEVLADEKVMGQIFDYIMAVRSVSGVRFGCGIVTTYMAWRFCWLADSDAAVRARTPDEFHAAELSDFADSIPRELYYVDFAYDDPMLIRALATFVTKLSTSLVIPCKQWLDDARWCMQVRDPLVQPPRAAQTTRADRAARATQPDDGLATFVRLPVFSQSLAAKKELSIAMPTKRSDRFLLLHDLGGGDAQVVLACTPQGNLVVIKFQDEEETLLAERDCWEEWNGVSSAYVTKLRNRPALVMPFVFYYSASKGGFVGLGGRTLSGDVVKELAVLDKLPIPSPEEVKGELLRVAERMGMGRRSHGDLEDRHMALLPVAVDGGKWTLKPIFIDFGRATDAASPTEVMSSIDKWASSGVCVRRAPDLPFDRVHCLDHGWGKMECVRGVKSGLLAALSHSRDRFVV